MAQGIKRVTINRELVYISGMLSKAVEHHKLSKRPKIPYFKLEQGEGQRTRILKQSEIGKILAYYKAPTGRGVRRSSKLRYPMILLLAVTGMRAEEVLGLRKDAYEDGQIVLPGELTKNGKPKRLPLPVELCELIEAHIASNPGEYVFRKPGQKPKTHYSNFYDHFKRVVKSLGIARPEQVNIHTFRHTAATGLLRDGAAPQTAMGITGHSNIKMLQRYLHEEDEPKLAALTTRHAAVMDAIAQSTEVEPAQQVTEVRAGARSRFGHTSKAAS